MRRLAIVLVMTLVVVGAAPPSGMSPAVAQEAVHVRVRLWQPRLFDRVLVTGQIRGGEAGDRVPVWLLHAGQEVARRHPTVRPDGSFRTELPVRTPGWYRAFAQVAPVGSAAVTDRSKARRTPLPALSRGASGTFVRLLERRLVSLGYRLEGVGGAYDARTGDAVVAFHKVQRMPRRFDVTEATWRALASPIRPHPRSDRPARHIEIDQTRQVLYAVRDGAIAWISHVSTGKASTPTYDGTFRVYRKVAGTYHGLYYPSYFDGGRAIHGWESVPTYPASHGCIRFPFWNAEWIYRHAPIDTVVRIYH
jgi:N-acetylmuramoyl-L-alanine amidase